MTACGCHDPIVFGHHESCLDELGPRRTLAELQAAYKRRSLLDRAPADRVVRSTEEIAALPQECTCVHFRSVVTGFWTLFRKGKCPVH